MDPQAPAPQFKPLPQLGQQAPQQFKPAPQASGFRPQPMRPAGIHRIISNDQFGNFQVAPVERRSIPAEPMQQAYGGGGQ